MMMIFEKLTVVKKFNRCRVWSCTYFLFVSSVCDVYLYVLGLPCATWSSCSSTRDRNISV